MSARVVFGGRCPAAGGECPVTIVTVVTVAAATATAAAAAAAAAATGHCSLQSLTDTFVAEALSGDAQSVVARSSDDRMPG